MGGYDDGHLGIFETTGTIKKCSVLCMTFEELLTSQVSKKPDCIYLCLKLATFHNKLKVF